MHLGGAADAQLHFKVIKGDRLLADILEITMNKKVAIMQVSCCRLNPGTWQLHWSTEAERASTGYLHQSTRQRRDLSSPMLTSILYPQPCTSHLQMYPSGASHVFYRIYQRHPYVKAVLQFVHDKLLVLHHRTVSFENSKFIRIYVHVWGMAWLLIKRYWEEMPQCVALYPTTLMGKRLSAVRYDHCTESEQQRYSKGLQLLLNISRETMCHSPKKTRNLVIFELFR